jgi:hypothetical protein
MYQSAVRPGLMVRLLTRAFAVVSLRGNAHMHVCPVLALSLGLVAGTVLPTSAQLPLSQASADSPCDVSAVASGRRAGQAIVATVQRVDPGHGQLEFTTERGAFVLTTTAAIDDLHVGDQFVLCLHADESEGAARVAQEDPAATAQPSDMLDPRSESVLEHQTTPTEKKQRETRPE